MSDKAGLTTYIERAKAGDAESFDHLVSQFQNYAVGYAFTLTGNGRDAEDVAQEAFLAAWQQIGSLRDGAAFPGWLRQIVFKYADRVRRQRRPVVPLDSIAEGADFDSDPGAHFLQRERRIAVQTALLSLSEADRAAVTLYYATGRKQAEIADFLGISVAAVKKRLERGRTRLRGVFVTMSIVENVLEGGAPTPNTRFVEVNRLLRDLTAQLEADPQVAAAYLARWGNDEGLGGQNDAWASLNLHVVVRDEYLDHFAGGRLGYASRVREPLLWVEAPQNAPPGGYYLMALYDGDAGPYEVDWYFRPLTQNRALPEQSVVLVNKAGQDADGPALGGGFNGTQPVYAEGVPVTLQALHDAKSETEKLREEQRNRISGFWAMWLISARYIARNPNEERMGFVKMLRDLMREVREGLGEGVAWPKEGELEDGTQPLPEQKVALLRALAAEMEGLHARATAQGVAVPVAIVPRAHRFLALVSEAVRISLA